jgi:hypothetical protein
MKKAINFKTKKQIDEWNPHIVRFPREKIPEDKYPLLFGNDQSAQLLDSHFQEWMTKWNEAQRILNGKKKIGIYPLAYRLEPKLSEVLELDSLEDSKFGGIPDFRQEYGFKFPKNKTLNQLIKEKWPKCSCCYEPMNFLCGLDMNDWLLTIHNMTSTNSIGENKYQNSGLGFDKAVGINSWPSHSIKWNIFYCKEPHFDNPNSDAGIRINHIFKSSNLELTSKEKVWSQEEYAQAISKVTIANKITSNIPIQKITGYSLKFDVDIPGTEFYPDWITEETEKYPQIFGKKSKYQFFGQPHSQQMPKRYFCQNSYLGVHRMAPIVNWTDQDNDFSYQIYSCLRCGNESNYAWAKTDGSCT